MKLFNRISLAAAAAVTAASLATTSARAEDQLSAVHAFPDFLVYTKTFLSIVDDINERGKGIVQITVRGGPEAIGMFEQPGAVRDGVVDIFHGPGSFYGASVPEIDAMVAANVTPMEARANGGIALMDEAHQARFNSKYLGWVDGGIKFHIYEVNEPSFDDNGVLDLTGVKLRDNPIYHAFFEALNATTASMPSTEVYSALEKGVADATAWTSIGLRELKWDKFLKYRVNPDFYNTDIGIIMNLESWEGLTPESQKLIQDVIVEWEQKSFDARQEDKKVDEAALQEGGMTFVEMSPEGAAKYLELADNAAWDRMKARLADMGDTTSYDKLWATYHAN